MNKNKKAFTLVELLVSLAIIALLATLSIISYSDVRQSAKDLERLNAVKQIQLALDLYRRNLGFYPATLDFGGTLSDEETIYLKKIPTNPWPENETICPVAEFSYSSDGRFYYLEFCLEAGQKDFSSGYHCAGISGISDGHCP